MKTQKIYSKQTLKGGLHWFFDIGDYHITMRLAGKPSLLLEQFRNKYGNEGDTKYLELLEMIANIGNKNKSAFVYYINKKED